MGLDESLTLNKEKVSYPWASMKLVRLTCFAVLLHICLQGYCPGS